jgi:Skp family chaperone for outer membrane proteins
MNDTELLLSDEFVSFSKVIASVHDEKKVLEEDFKKHFEDYKNKKKEMEALVTAANAKWEDWKKSKAAVKKEKA